MNRDAVMSVVMKQIRLNAIGLDDREIDPSRSMLDYGISSLDIVEIVSGSMRELQLRVPRTRLANLKNIDELVDVFVGVTSGGGDVASPLERAADSRG